MSNDYEQKFSNLFALWEKGQYREVRKQLGDILDKDLQADGVRRLEKWLSNLVDKTDRASAAYQENDVETARKHIETAQQIPSIDAWRDSYAPLSELLKNPELQLPAAGQGEEAGKSLEIGKPLILDGNETDAKVKLIQRKKEYLSDANLRLDEEIKYIDDLLKDSEEADLLGQSLEIRKLVAQADYQERLNKPEESFNLYLKAQQELQRKSGGNSAELRARIALGVGKVWKEVSQKYLDAIQQLIDKGKFDEALSACDELGNINANPGPEIDPLRRQIAAKKEAARVGKITLGEVGRALEEGDLSLAEKYLQREDVLASPDASKMTQRVKKAREEVDALFATAESKSKQLAFAEAGAIYKQILEKDKTNNKAPSKLTEVRADQVRLAKIDSLLSEVQQALKTHEIKDAKLAYQQANDLDKLDWRKEQRDSLNADIFNLQEKLRVAANTFHEDVEKGKYKWPEEFERFILDMYKILELPEHDIQQMIEQEAPVYLKQHYEFLAHEMNDILHGNIQAGLLRMYEIQEHWQPFLNDKKRLGSHISNELLDTVYKSTQNIIGLIPTYKRAADFVKKIEAAQKISDTTLKQGKGHMDAIHVVDECLESAPPTDDPVMDLLGDTYAELKDLLNNLRAAYQANSASHLSEVQTYLKIGKYADAKESLKTLEPIDKLETGTQTLWYALNADTQICLQMEDTFEKGRILWNKGKWHEAQSEFLNVTKFTDALKSDFFKQNEFAPILTKKEAQDYLGTLEFKDGEDDFISLTARLADFSRKAVKEENQNDLSKLLQNSLLMRVRVKNRFLSNLFQSLSIRLEQYLQFKESLVSYQLADAAKILERIKKGADRVYLERLLEQYRRAGTAMKGVEDDLKRADGTDDLDEVTNLLHTCLESAKDIEKLNIRNRELLNVAHRVSQFENWLKSLSQTHENLEKAHRSQSAKRYDEARDQMRDALINVPERFKALREKLDRDLNRLTRLAHFEEPYFGKVKEGESLLQAGSNHGILLEAQKALQEAKKTLKNSPPGLDESVLEAAERLWLKKLEEAVAREWELSEYLSVSELLQIWENADLSTGKESPILEEHERLMALRMARQALETAMRERNLQESKKSYGEFKRYVSPKNADESRESILWEKRLDALELANKADKLLSSLGDSQDHKEMDSCADQLEVKAEDYWPEPKKASDKLRDLRYQSAVLQASEAEKRGKVEQALQTVKQALEFKQEPAMQQKKEILQELISLHGKAVKAKNAGKLAEAVDYVRQCQSKSTKDFEVEGKLLGDLQNEMINLLTQKADESQQRGMYVEALEYFELIKKMDFNDTRRETLREELRQKLRELRKRYDEISANYVKAEPVTIENLLEDLDPVQRRWGLNEAETSWMPSAQSELSKWKLEIEELGTHVAKAWDLLVEAKNGTEESKFFAATDEFFRFRGYVDREEVRKVYDEVGRWAQAFRQISDALEEFQADQNRKSHIAKVKLAETIKGCDPNKELLISRNANKILGENP